MKLLIVGVGSPLRGDDGFGVEVVRQLSGAPLPDGVVAVDGGTAGFGLADLLGQAESVLVIDAAEMGRTPGSIVEFTPDQVRSLASEHPLSAHQADILGVLRLLSGLGVSPAVTILAVQPARVDHGIGLSREVEEAIPEVLRRVREKTAFAG